MSSEYTSYSNKHNLKFKDQRCHQQPSVEPQVVRPAPESAAQEESDTL